MTAEELIAQNIDTRRKTLDLSSKKLTYLPVELSKCVWLEVLNFSNHNVSDISVLHNLTNLKNLCFSNNNVSDISVLHNLTNLESLHFSNNNVSDISVLHNLTNLKNLDFSNNNVSNISVLHNLTNLKNLNFSKNDVSNISDLSALTNLESLYFAENPINSRLQIFYLSNLHNLEYLNYSKGKRYIFNNRYLFVYALRNLNKLTHLTLTNFYFIEHSIFANFTDLRYLKLSDFFDTSFVIDKTEFTAFWNSVDAIHEDLMPTLIYDFNSEISLDFSFLNTLIKLEHLDLSGVLNLNNTLDLSNLTSLTYLNLEDTSINISMLNSLQKLGHLKTLDIVKGNSLDCKSLKKLKKWLPNTTIK